MLANVAEGEPASNKDRVLLEGLPHLVLDGGVLAARAVGADELILCIDESAGRALQSASVRSESASGAAETAEDQIQIVPGGYVCGQESALVNLCNGGPAKPTLTPPMPFQRGVRQRPTLINNAETLAHLALIARHGPQWFRAARHAGAPGSTLLTLSGAVAYPGVYEIEHGAPLASLIEAAGGSDLPDPCGAARRLCAAPGSTASRSPRLALSNDHLAATGRRSARGRRAALSRGLPGGRDLSCRALAGRAERRSMRTLRARPATRSPARSKRSLAGGRPPGWSSASPTGARSRRDGEPAATRTAS